MFKLVLGFGLLAMTFVTSAHANVSIIQSKINGVGHKTIGKTISILSPSITLDGQTYELHTGSVTARSACEMLGLDYLDFDQSDAKLAKRVRIDENGSIEFVEGARSLGILSCKIKN